MHWGKLGRWFLGTALLEIKDRELPLESWVPGSWGGKQPAMVVMPHMISEMDHE
jgi:hypothetical protein